MLGLTPFFQKFKKEGGLIFGDGPDEERLSLGADGGGIESRVDQLECQVRVAMGQGFRHGGDGARGRRGGEFWQRGVHWSGAEWTRREDWSWVEQLLSGLIF
ncbi:MAG: hypothetical protein HC904_07230 [Blastochloris sp.]|nr:hypothetical protein [Blastochloris sp.]